MNFITIEIVDNLVNFSDVIQNAEMSTERDAVLLETGIYPEKGLTVTEADLDGIVSRFSSAPVKVEHVDSPLDPLGVIKSIQRVGKQLVGKLAFPPDLSSFMRRRGAAKLSVGLSQNPLSLQEVSLVLKPHVAAATLFSDPANPSYAELEARAKEIARLKAQLNDGLVNSQIAKLKAEGRVVPATELFARSLLSVPSEALVTFADGKTLPVASVALQLLEAQPPIVTFMAGGGAVAATLVPDAGGALTDEEKAFLRDRLGVDPAKVEHHMAHGHSMSYGMKKVMG